MKYLLLFLIVAGILPGASQTTVNYTRKNGDKVIHTIFNKTTTWAKAEIECESIGAHLGYFEDLNEAQTVLGEFELTDCRLTKGTCEGALWMGAQRVADKKDYKWLFESNEPLVPKSDFRKGDPDGGDQNCLAVFLPGYKYGDLHCVYDYAEYQNYLYRILGFVCTKKEKD
ncbi:hypothetical protein Q1695_013040 [Nippostrongylus brasiliensis]|nr:hypothetical protein Q1695_013040 [Nippostrongylus brasiliensis]